MYLKNLEVGRRIWIRYKTNANVISMNCHYPSTHPGDSPAPVIPSSSRLMEKPGKTPRSPTRAWQAVPVVWLIPLGSSRSSSLHTFPWQPWFLSSALTLTSGEHLLPWWWQPAAGGFHWGTPWQWHRWKVVNLGEKSQVSFANKELQETQPFVKFQVATGWKYQQSFCSESFCLWMEGGDQLCVRRMFLELFFFFKNLTAQLNNLCVFIY